MRDLPLGHADASGDIGLSPSKPMPHGAREGTDAQIVHRVHAPDEGHAAPNYTPAVTPDRGLPLVFDAPHRERCG